MTETRANGGPYRDFWYHSQDGLKLYARDYNNAPASASTNAPTLLCMHGLTRNSADFEDICAQLDGRFRLIVPDQRGRGRSQYDKNPDNYTPLTYVQDMFVLLEQLDIASAVLVGTSMGGIMAMLMAVSKPEMAQGIVLNDIGPQVSTIGLGRIKTYVGLSKPVKNWDQAAQQVCDINRVAFPNYDQQQWLNFAKRLYREDANGCPQLAYDSGISKAITERENNSAAPDLWPVFEQIVDIPMLCIRGELSDILDQSCVSKMQKIDKELQVAEIPNIGHAPVLDEPESTAAIEHFLQQFT